MRVLIVGGYGVFGARLVRLLANEAHLTVLVAGRSAAKARALCETTPALAKLIPTVFDRNGDLQAQLAAAAPDLVVDASGPFQGYGEAPWRLVGAAIAFGASYIDLADGSEFVAGIAAFNEVARARGVFVLSGASSFPVLSSAAVRQITQGWRRVLSVTAGVAPSPRAGVGENVVRAIASYAGKPVPLLRDGKPTFGVGLADTRRMTIAPPGALPLTSTRFALVDVPDLRLLPKLWPELRDTWVGAGTRPQSLHWLLGVLARLVSWKLFPGLTPLSGLFHAVLNRALWGEHRGGMIVEATGEDADGAPVRTAWALVAEGDDGPMIPSMAAAALIRRILAGAPPPAGARAANAEVELADYQLFFDAGAFIHGLRSAVSAEAPVYRQILSDGFELLPAPIRAMHDLRTGALVAHGRGEVRRGTGLLSRLAGAIIGFPPAIADTPVTVTFERKGRLEIWRRDFGGRRFSSLQEAGKRRSDALMVERFGPLAFSMALVIADGRMTLVMRRWTALGIPMPMALCPRITASEEVVEERFRFHVDISHPLTGPIVAYRGWLDSPTPL